MNKRRKGWVESDNKTGGEKVPFIQYSNFKTTKQ